MSDFVHHDLGYQAAGAVVEIAIRERANVQLVDATNFRNYKSGRPFRYVGGEALKTLLRLVTPHADHWHVVIDLGGAPGTIHSTVEVL